MMDLSSWKVTASNPARQRDSLSIPFFEKRRQARGSGEPVVECKKGMLQ